VINTLPTKEFLGALRGKPGNRKKAAKK